MDLISVIIPIYNVNRYLQRCLDSLSNQTYKNIEVILVDDGSTDGSGETCDLYAEKNTCFTVIHKENGGLGFARNTGMDHAQGKYILFVDGDDYIQSDMIQNLYNDMLYTNADTCIGGFRRVYKDRVVICESQRADRLYVDQDVQKEVLVRMVGKKNDMTDFIEMSVWKVLFSKDIIDENNLRFSSERVFISEDLIFNTEYYKYAKRVYISRDTGYCYCDNDGSLTTKYRANRFELQKTLYFEMIKRMKELDLYQESTQRLNTTFILVTRYCIKLEVKFAYDNSKPVAIKNIKTICYDYVLQQALKEYDNSLVPYKSRIINVLIKNKCIFILYGIMKLKNKYNI